MLTTTPREVKNATRHGVLRQRTNILLQTLDFLILTLIIGIVHCSNIEEKPAMKIS